MFKKTITFIYLAAAALSAPFSLLAEAPNVIIVLTDDQGYWAMGSAGNDEIRTPNLDQLAETSRGSYKVCIRLSPDTMALTVTSILLSWFLTNTGSCEGSWANLV